MAEGKVISKPVLGSREKTPGASPPDEPQVTLLPILGSAPLCDCAQLIAGDRLLDRQRIPETPHPHARLLEVHLVAPERDRFAHPEPLPVHHEHQGMIARAVPAALRGLEPMKSVAATLMRHADGILAWFDSRVANCLIEAINSLVQVAKAKARGYRTIRNLMAITYLVAGKLDLKQPT
jgi:hypothetical protein